MKKVLSLAQGCRGIFVLRYGFVAAATFSSLILSDASAQGIFEGLPYSESEIRSKISQHTISYHSTDGKDEIPSNVYYRHIFISMLSDDGLLKSLPSSDLQLIEALPAHDDEVFVTKDQLELGAICKAPNLQDTSASVQEMATAFDESRIRRESDLDNHYANVLAQLTPTTRQYVMGRLESGYFNVTYSAFNIGSLAGDSPDIAKVILLNGCDNFFEQQDVFALKKVLLKDQLLGQPITAITR